LLRWFQPRDSEPEDERLFDQSTFDDLMREYVGRVAQADAEGPLYRQFGADATAMYWWWSKANSQAVSDCLLAHLGNAPEEIDVFLDAFVSETWGLESGLPGRGDMDRDAYNQIARLMSPDAVVQRLRERHGPQLDHPEYHHGNDVALATRIAHQFVVVHNAVVQEVGEESAATDAHEAAPPAQGATEPRADEPIPEGRTEENGG
jgi:hypothetical protein